ncbi:hypothetical protein Bca52824_011345 [Brassica carinata]|uniref:Uncharacterized protein n=1 Tax=Brassica carinata TaxID=52824 RepID=A0A8X8BC51_BRACI|nr:hypothetical protein Bca52824_011345 [Brassica carinata]
MFCGWRLAYLLSSESAKEHNLTKFYSLRQNIIFFVGQTIFLKQWGVTESSQSYWSVLLRKSGAAVATTYFELYIVLKIIEFEEHSRLQLWLNTDLFRLIAVESMEDENSQALIIDDETFQMKHKWKRKDLPFTCLKVARVQILGLLDFKYELQAPQTSTKRRITVLAGYMISFYTMHCKLDVVWTYRVRMLLHEHGVVYKLERKIVHVGLVEPVSTEQLLQIHVQKQQKKRKFLKCWMFKYKDSSIKAASQAVVDMGLRRHWYQLTMACFRCEHYKRICNSDQRQEGHYDRMEATKPLSEGLKQCVYSVEVLVVLQNTVTLVHFTAEDATVVMCSKYTIFRCIVRHQSSSGPIDAITAAELMPVM